MFRETNFKFYEILSRRFRRKTWVACIMMIFSGSVGLHNIYTGRYHVAAFQAALLFVAVYCSEYKILSYVALAVLVASNLYDICFMRHFVRASNLEHADNLI